jgi:HK97 family phage major capsid protein
VDLINQLKQAAIEAAANVVAQENALTALLDAQAGARTAYRALLKQQADGNLKTDEDKSKLVAAEAAVEGFEPRLSGQRKLIAEGKKDAATADAALKVEAERLAAEDAKLAKNPSGRISVAAPNATRDPKRGFADHTDFLRAVMRAGRFGQVDERLVPLAAQGTDEQQTSANPYGGFFAPVGIAPGVLSVAPELDPIDALVRRIPMTAPTVKFNARVDKVHSSSVSGGFRVYRRAETVDGLTSRAEFEQVTLTANEEFGAVHATEAVINDSPESFIAIIQSGMSDEFVAARMNERINGTGIGERQGILNTPCLISVAKEVGQAAASIITENIDKMAARCWRYSQAVWLANHNTRPQLKGLVRVVGTGGSVVPYFVTSPSGGGETLDGRPIFFTEYAKGIGTVGDLILGVWSEHLDGTYQTEQFAESMHVRFLAAERTFRFYRRNDGQWWWRSALTPKNGDTLSPAVVLATRA